MSIDEEDAQSKDVAGYDSADASDLASKEAAEADAGASTSTDSGGSEEGPDLYNPSADKSGSKKGRFNSKKVFSKKRLLWLGPIGLILILFLLLSMLKIPNYAANIAAYRLARTAMEYAKTSAQIDAEKIGLDQGGKLKATYEKIRGNTWGKLDKYRPAKVLENLKSEGKLQYVQTGDRIVDVKINGQSYSKPTNPGLGRNITNPISTLKDSYKARIEFAARIDAALQDSLRDYNTLVRGAVAKGIRSELGLRLVFWQKFSKTFKGTAAAEADRLTANAFEKLNNGVDLVDDGWTTPAFKDAGEEFDNVLANCRKDPKCYERLAKGELNDDVLKSLSKLGKEVAGESISTKLLTTINAWLGIIFPICLIYEGSLEKAGPSIDNQSSMATLAFYSLETASDQQKAGDTSMEAVDAMGRKIGDGDSTIDQIYRGETVDTSLQKSPQSSPMGTYTLFDGLLGDELADIVNGAADAVCPLLNLESMVGLTLISFAAKFLGPQEAMVEEAGKRGVETAFGKILKSYLKNTFEKLGSLRISVKGVGSKAKLLFTHPIKAVKGALKTTKKIRGFAWKVGRDIAIIEAGTWAARLLVVSKVGLMNNPESSANGDFRDLADAGGDLHGNEMNRKYAYGGPLGEADVAAADLAVANYLDNQEKTKPMFDRYFALSNPRSLVSKMSYRLASIKNIGLGDAVYRLINNINFAAISNIFFPSNKHVLATEATSTAHYGIVQWGWTSAENDLINNNDTYGVLENARIVEDQSNKVIFDAIQQAYDKCYTSSMGTLLSAGDIVRDENGSIVADKGDCSPENLGPNNPMYGDNVFRWRLYNERNNVLDHNLGIQEPAATSDTSSTPGSGDCAGLTLTGPEHGHGGNEVIDGHDQYLLPRNNPGYVAQHPEEQQWGGKALIQTIWQVGLKWNAAHPDGPKIAIGGLDESAGHRSHVTGEDVDTLGCPFYQSCGNYKREYAVELGKYFMEAGNIDVIFYNDESVQDEVNAYATKNNLPGKMEYYAGHSNHFHVRILNYDKTPVGCSE